jgi:hypothetical protein
MVPPDRGSEPGGEESTASSRQSPTTVDGMTTNCSSACRQNADAPDSGWCHPGVVADGYPGGQILPPSQASTQGFLSQEAHPEDLVQAIQCLKNRDSGPLHEC